MYMTHSGLSCIKCSHKELWKAGFYKDMQVYRCKSCKREFTERSKSKYSGQMFLKKIILFSVMLYKYGLSSYATSEVLRKRFRTKVSAWTVCKWARSLGTSTSPPAPEHRIREDMAYR